MVYVLTHKNTTVAELEIDEESAAITRVGAVFAPERIPVGVTVRNGHPDRGDLNDWWQGRSIPASRQNLSKALVNLGVGGASKLLTKCFGLSLSDHYWVNPASSPLKWEEVNFFDNPFSEDVGDALFGSVNYGKELDLVSPDNTSDGWLKKKWRIVGGKRCLIKGGSDPFQQQPLNEAMASRIMQRLRVPHVPYTVQWEEGLPYSVCENFVSRETELVSAYYIHNTKKIADTNNLYDHYVACCASLGILDAQLALDRMLVVDYLIVNADRHWNNFGAIRNAKTLAWVSHAPLYDNGSSLWYNQSVDGIRKVQASQSQPFCATHEEQICLVKDFSWLDPADLAGVDEEFCELLRPSPFIDEARRDALCFALRHRAQMLVGLANCGA